MEQTAGLIREGVRAGRWRTRMPGQGILAKEFGVSGKTVYGALRLLMEEGLLASDGKGRGALICGKGARGADAKPSGRMLRVVVFSMLPAKDMYPEHHHALTRLTRNLENDGHATRFVAFPEGKDPTKTGYVAKLVREADADVWLIYLGTHEVLQWFAKSGLTVLAIGGRFGELPIPNIVSDTGGCVARAVRRLSALGHRRIVLIAQKAWRVPTPGQAVKAFLLSMEELGHRPGEFHLPEWEETREGLARLLDTLFQVTPPTALICIAPRSTTGALGWLLAHGRRIPADVSLIALGPDDGVEWCVPGLDIVCMESDMPALWRRVREWVSEVAEGRINRAAITFDVKLSDGNSVGPPPDSGSNAIFQKHRGSVLQ